MGIFNKVNKAAVSSLPPAQKAAAAGGGNYTAQIGQFYTYYSSAYRNRAMSVPTISRARDLIASVVSATPLRMFNEMWNGEEIEKVYIAPRSWIRQPDPTIPYGTLMAWTLDDLFFSGRAFWYIQERTADGFPSRFTRLPASMINTADQIGPIFYGPSKEIEFNGQMIDHNNVVQFIAPIQGIVYQSAQCIDTALRLEQSRFKNALSSMPSGVLKQTGGEPLSPAELSDLAAAFNAARESNQTAALNQFIDYSETQATPDKMMMMEAAAYQALECARLTNIPPYLAGISTGSYAYTNSRSAREDLYLFSARSYMDCIAGTLSMNNVLPRGTFMEFDLETYLNDLAHNEIEDMPEMSTVIEQPSQNTQEELAQ